MTSRLFFIILFIILSPHALAQERPVFILPLECTLARDCWVTNYPDVAPAVGEAKDYKCRARTYDGHHGTDFAIADLVAMEQGVNVLAGADGSVLRVRDGVEDDLTDEQERKQLLSEKRGCGNGVVIEHENGWMSIYCHFKKGSVLVKPGQKVKQGDKIGQAGLSGIAQFPHLHFGIFQSGMSYDPATGRKEEEGCGHNGIPLWKNPAALSYRHFDLYAAGFKSAAPDFEAIKIDTHSPDSLPAHSEALVFWAGYFGASAKDKINLTITNPAGKIIAERQITQDKDRARQFYYIGKKNSGRALPPGPYRGVMNVMRVLTNGETIEDYISRTVIIQP